MALLPVPAAEEPSQEMAAGTGEQPTHSVAALTQAAGVLAGILEMVVLLLPVPAAEGQAATHLLLAMAQRMEAVWVYLVKAQTVYFLEALVLVDAALCMVGGIHTNQQRVLAEAQSA